MHIFPIESHFNFVCQSLVGSVGHQALAPAQDLYCVGYITIVDRDLQLSFSCCIRFYWYEISAYYRHMCLPAKADYGPIL